MVERRLILMRHAKSAWDTGAGSDHARALNPRGLRDAPRIGTRLIDMGWRPDLVLLSDAVRTRETLQHLFGGVAERPAEALEPRFYLGGIEEIRDVLLEQDDRYRTLMVLGHNPGWESALQWLTGQAERLTTANAALLTCSADSWAETVVAPQRFVLSTVLRPKELMDA